MTKVDRMEFDRLMSAYSKQDYYGALAMNQCIEYRMLSKRDALVQLKERVS